MSDHDINDTLARFADYIRQQSAKGAAMKRKRKRRNGIDVEVQPEPLEHDYSLQLWKYWSAVRASRDQASEKKNSIRSDTLLVLAETLACSPPPGLQTRVVKHLTIVGCFLCHVTHPIKWVIMDALTAWFSSINIHEAPKEKYTEASDDLLQHLLGVLIDHSNPNLERCKCASLMVALVSRDNKMKAALLEGSKHDFHDIGARLQYFFAIQEISADLVESFQSFLDRSSSPSWLLKLYKARNHYVFSPGSELPIRKLLVNKKSIKIREAWMLTTSTQLIILHGSDPDDTIVYNLGQITNVKRNQKLQVRLSLASTSMSDGQDIAVTFDSKDLVEQCCSQLKTSMTADVPERPYKVSKTVDVIRAPAKHITSLIAQEQDAAECGSAVERDASTSGEAIIEESASQNLEDNQRRIEKAVQESTCIADGRSEPLRAGNSGPHDAMQLCSNVYEPKNDEYNMLSPLSSISISDCDGVSGPTEVKTMPGNSESTDPSLESAIQPPLNHPDVEAMFDDLASVIQPAAEKPCLPLSVSMQSQVGSRDSVDDHGCVPTISPTGAGVSDCKPFRRSRAIKGQKTSPTTSKLCVRNKAPDSFRTSRDEEVMMCDTLPAQVSVINKSDFGETGKMTRMKATVSTSGLELTRKSKSRDILEPPKRNQAEQDVLHEMVMTRTKLHDQTMPVTPPRTSRRYMTCHRPFTDQHVDVAVQRSPPAAVLSQGEPGTDLRDTETAIYVDPKLLSKHTSHDDAQKSYVSFADNNDTKEKIVIAHNKAWLASPRLVKKIGLVDETTARKAKIVQWDNKLGPTGLRSPCITSEQQPLRSPMKERSTRRAKVICKQRNALGHARKKINGRLGERKEQPSRKICEALSNASSVSPIMSPTPGAAHCIDTPLPHPEGIELYTSKFIDTKTEASPPHESVYQKSHLSDVKAISAIVQDFNASITERKLESARQTDQKHQNGLKVDVTEMKKTANEQSMTIGFENAVAPSTKDLRGLLRSKGLLPSASHAILSSGKRPTSTKMTAATPSIDSDDSESQANRAPEDCYRESLPAHQRDMFDILDKVTKEMLSCIQAQEDLLSTHAVKASERARQIFQAYLECQEASHKQVLSKIKAAVQTAFHV